MNNNRIFFAKVKQNARIPSKREEDSGYDIYGCFQDDKLVLEPGDIKMIPTGIATAFPSIYVLFIKERSSTGAIGLSTRMGVVDSGYRGEIMIAMNNTSNKTIVIDRNVSTISCEDNKIIFPSGKAIAQAVLCLIPQIDTEELEYESLLQIPSHRGVTFMGSSGK